MSARIDTGARPGWFDVALEERVIGLQLRRRAADSSDRLFLQFDERRWTFAEADRLARAVARGLVRRGIGRDDRVMLMLPNLPEFVFAWLGTALIGAVVIPIDPRMTGHLLDYLLDDARPRCLVIAASLLATLAKADPARVRGLRRVIVVDDGADHAQLGPGHDHWRDLLEFDGPDPEIPVEYDETTMVMYTSGSSGAPKGVIMSSAHTFSSGITMVRGTALNRDDVLFAPLPLFHGMSSRIGVLPALLLGIPIAITRFSVSHYWQQAAACGATVGLIVPTMPNLLLAQPPGPFDRAHRMRVMFNARPDPAFLERFGVEVLESYGMTEISHVISAAYHERRVGSCGRQQPHWDVRLVDDAGREVAPGLVGEIIARPHERVLMLRGYLNKPELTAEAIRDGWFHTADYAWKDADGYFHFIGRKAERIRRLGENISALEVEDTVGRHPEVSACAAMAHPAPLGEDDVRLVVVRRPEVGLTAPVLHAWLADKLPRFMMPTYIEFATDLPRTETGKVNKRIMIERGLAPDCWKSGTR